MKWWWYHVNTIMVLNAPLYVIICEALISLSLPLIIYYSEHNKITKTISFAIIEGIWILISAFIAYNLV
ncbi:MAG TPA: hypothetical protein PKL31_00175 [Fulvivirga sp.]|nr:hypothetical protein [Fulvivirga sp.]